MEKAMELVRKEHYFAFCKHLLICDPTLGLDFFKEIQVHYDMNLEPKMFMKKLQMLTYSCVTPQQKLSWLKTWNESNVLKEAKKFLEQGFLDQQFDKWFHKAIF